MGLFDNQAFEQALNKLGAKFALLNWNFSPSAEYGNIEPVSHWIGEDDEDVMVCVFKGNWLCEQFHRNDFFFLHFAYKNGFRAISGLPNNLIEVKEGECYIGHPFSGYAVQSRARDESIIIGVLIKKSAIVDDFLPAFAMDATLLNFFLEPHKNLYSEEFVRLNIPKSSIIWQLLGLIVMEYASKGEDTKKIIKPLVVALCLYISSEYKRQRLPMKKSLTEQMAEYIDSNADTVTLSSLAAKFGYHPVYVSRLLGKNTGSSFTQLVLKSRMQKAKTLLTHTDLFVEKISLMLGYGNSSNFYKAFKEYFGMSPRDIGRS